MNNISKEELEAHKSSIRITIPSVVFDKKEELPSYLYIAFGGLRINRKVWYQEDLLYDYAFKNLIDFSCCPACSKAGINKEYVSKLDSIITTNDYNDTSYYTDYRVYRCRACGYGWTEWWQSKSYTEISFP